MFDFLKTDEEKVKDRVPAVFTRYDDLSRIWGNKAPLFWLKELVDLGDVLRASRIRYLADGRTGSEANIWRGWFGEKTPERELDWWAMRAVWNDLKGQGDVIDGGPDEIPDLWSDEFDTFVRAVVGDRVDGPGDNFD